ERGEVAENALQRVAAVGVVARDRDGLARAREALRVHDDAKRARGGEASVNVDLEALQLALDVLGAGIEGEAQLARPLAPLARQRAALFGRHLVADRRHVALVALAPEQDGRDLERGVEQEAEHSPHLNIASWEARQTPGPVSLG